MSSDETAVALAAGTVVGGRFEVIERIGAGAMGMVYLATDRGLERKVALKLHKKHAGTEQLRREALAMARLAHPNVVAVFEVGEHEGRTFVAMEYVAGTTLREWIAAEQRTPAEILAALLSAGEGLIAAHDAKLVHRDFKPENVLIGSDGRPRVSDFGLARESGHEVAGAEGGNRGSTGVVGTPQYMAPEQAAGISVDARADQYAFCAVAKEVLPGAGPRMRRVLERGLSQDPSSRHSSMRALLAALRAARSPRYLVLGGIASALAAAAIAVAFAWPASTTEAASCASAGIEILPIALDVPARIAAEQPAVVAATARDRLARYRASYVATAGTVCRNGTDRTWSADLYDRGRACLDLQRRIFASSLEATHLPVFDLVDRVVRLIDETACGDPSVLASQPPLHGDPEAITRAVVTIEAANTDHTEVRHAALARAVADVEASSVAREPFVAVRLDELRATLLEHEGKSKEAQAMFEKAYYAARGIDDAALSMRIMARIVAALVKLPHDSAADKWIAVAFADAKRMQSRAPYAAAGVYSMVAATHDTFGDPEKAIAAASEALAILGDTPSRTRADALMIRGSSYITSGKPDLARADYAKGDQLFEALYGPAHPLVARIKLEISAAMAALGRKEDSARYAREAEAILDRNPSLASGDVAVMKLNLAASYANEKDYAKSLKYFAESRAMTIAVHGPDHPDIALIDTNVAMISVEQNDFATGMKQAREALALMDRTTPKPHEDRGQLYLVISDAARGLADVDTAISAAVSSANEYADGDDRKPLALAFAARNANEGKRHARALELLATARALPATDPQVAGRIQLEYARASIALGRDRAGATTALDEARKSFADAEMPDLVGEVDATRAKLR